MQSRAACAGCLDEDFEKQPCNWNVGSQASNEQWYGISRGYTFFALSLILWYGSTLLASREYNLVQFFVMYMPLHFFSNNRVMCLVMGGSSSAMFMYSARLTLLIIARLLQIWLKREQERYLSRDCWKEFLKSIPGVQKGEEHDHQDKDIFASKMSTFDIRQGC